MSDPIDWARCAASLMDINIAQGVALQQAVQERDQLAAQVAACVERLVDCGEEICFGMGGKFDADTERRLTMEGLPDAAQRFLAADKLAEALSQCDVDWQTPRAERVKAALDAYRQACKG